LNNTVNNNSILIAGKSASGKSASLRNLKNPEGVLHMSCEAGKELPFANNFRKLTVIDPHQVLTTFERAEQSKKIHTLVIDTATFLMDMFESLFVVTAAPDERFSAWSAYAQFWKNLMQVHVAKSTKNVIILAHTSDVLNESEGVMETLVKVKGSTMNQGVEAYFCNVIAAKRVAISKLEDYANPHLIITPEEEALGFKYCFQTKLTKETVHERIRGPMGLWKNEETFIDNDAQFVLDQLHSYYN
jgi:hypothetical protein